MDKKWTKEQQEAIDLQKPHLLVSAGAGSGKTAVLVERILEKITDKSHPVDISTLLIVTFTRAAASEMRERISQAIYDRLANDPYNELLQQQLAHLSICDITTIDAFCLTIVKNNAVALQIDSTFSILDNMESEMLKSEILDQTLEELYQNGSSHFLSFAGKFVGLKNDDPLKNILLNTYSFLRSIPFYMDWLCQKINMYHRKESFEEWSHVIFHYLLPQLALCEKNYAVLLETFPKEKESQKAYEILSAEKEQCHILYDAVKQKDWDKAYLALQQINFVTLRMNIKDKEAASEYRALRDSSKTIMIRAKEEFITLDKESCLKNMNALYPLLQGLYEAISLFDQQLSEAKASKNSYEFSDAEHMALQLLSKKQGDQIVPSDYAYDIGNNYTEILMDEYQDTNELQEKIFNLMDNNCQRFYVGDLKQSIYKFRHANPYIFRQKMNTYYTDTKKDDVQINLLKNFRSRSSVLSSINTIFQDIMTNDLGDLDYQNAEELICGASYGAWQNQELEQTDLLLVDVNSVSSDDRDNMLDELTSYEKEALAISRRIKELMNAPFMIEDKGVCRPITFRDIVILMRSPSPSSEEFNRIFAAEGIPLYSNTAGQYFTSREMTIVISLLEIIDNPLNDIPLVCVLRSAIFHFTDEELLCIKLAGDFPYYYQKVCEVAKGDDLISQKCADFLAYLSNWQEQSYYLPVSDLLWKIYEDTDFFSICAVMNNGSKKIANLRLLYYKAEQYEKSHYRGLYHFIDFIKCVQMNGNDMGEAKMIAENQNVVRMMSIHNSKGLEFPVVFCAGMGKRFNQTDLNQKILLHNQIGIGLDYVDESLPYSYPNLSRTAVKLQLQKENLSEEMRLLYVAMTRAKEKLILVASLKNTEKSFDKWYKGSLLSKQMRTDYLMTNRSYIDWIMPSILRCNHINSYAQVTGQNEKNLFHIKEIDANNLQKTTDSSKEKPSSLEDKHKKMIDENFSYRYPFENATMTENKLSVSQLNQETTNKLYPRDYSNKVPQFLRKETKPTAAQIGTLNHLIMQKIDLQHTTRKDIEELKDHFLSEKLILPEEANYISSEEIENFFKSPLGMRLKQSKEVYREVSFEMNWPNENADNILIQGIIDCFFIERDSIILIDYKTNSSHTSFDILRQKYQTQIEVYASAIEKIMKKKPKEKFIYLFSDENVIKYD